MAAPPQTPPASPKVNQARAKAFNAANPNGAAAQRQSRQQARANKAQLNAYTRANGNMSVARRTAVVGGALEQLGYSRADAQRISLDAPLNASMYDDQAILTGLQYARMVSQLQPGTPSIAGALQPTPIPMPKDAATALQTAEDAQNPINSRRSAITSKASANLQRLADRFGEWTNNISEKIPTPGGIAALLTANLIFLAAIIPANPQGYTRLQLLWYTLLNQTKLPESVTPDPVPNDPFVAAIMGMAKGLEDIAVAVGTIGSDLGGVLGVISNPGQIIQNVPGAVGGIVGNIWHDVTGLSYDIPFNPGTNTPPPPPVTAV